MGQRLKVKEGEQVGSNGVEYFEIETPIDVVYRVGDRRVRLSADQVVVMNRRDGLNL
jgi:hypothetical protein